MTSLTWLVNEEVVPSGFVRPGGGGQRQLAVPNYPPLYDAASGADLLESPNGTALTLKFLLNPKHFVDGLIKLRCTASSIPALFSRSAEAVAQAEPLRGASSSGRYSSGQPS